MDKRGLDFIKFCTTPFKSKKATKENEGENWAILCNPQGVKDFNENPVWKQGVVKNVDNEGFFELKFPDGSYTICRSFRNLKKNKNE